MHAFRERVSLRLNEDDKIWMVWNIKQTSWELLSNRIFGSLTANVHGSMNGQRLTIASHKGYAQTIMVADTRTSMVIGMVNISRNGSLRFLDRPNFMLQAELPEYWQERTAFIIGARGPFTINVRDCCGNDEDIFRFKPGHNKWHIPIRYMKPTPDYDLVKPEQHWQRAESVCSSAATEQFDDCRSLASNRTVSSPPLPFMGQHQSESMANPTVNTAEQDGATPSTSRQGMRENQVQNIEETEPEPEVEVNASTPYDSEDEDPMNQTD